MRHNRRPIHAVREQAGSARRAPGGAQPDDGGDGWITAAMLARVKAYLAAGGKATADLENDWDAFRQLVSRKIRAYARGFRVKNDADIEDCLQEVWINLLELLPGFELDPGRGKFEAWLRQIVWRRKIDLHRAARRQPPSEGSVTLETLPDAHPDLVAIVADRDMLTVVWRHIESTLPEPDVEILRLRII